jgi:hypothetical protein
VINVGHIVPIPKSLRHNSRLPGLGQSIASGNVGVKPLRYYDKRQKNLVIGLGRRARFP